MELLLVRTLPRPILPPVEDDLPGAKFFPLDQEEPWLPPQPAVAWAAVPFTADDEGPSLAVPVLDQEDGPEYRLHELSVRPVARLADEVGASLANFGLEHEAAWIPAVESLPWQSIPFRDDETGSSLANFGLEQEDGWVRAKWSEIVYAVPFATEDVGPSPAALDPEDGPSFWIQPRTSNPVARPDDEQFSPPAVFVPDDESPWSAVRLCIAWSGFIFADEHPALSPVVVTAQIGGTWIAEPGGRVWSAGPGHRNWIAEPGGRTWVAGGRDMAGMVRNDLSESIPVAPSTVRMAMDFGDLPELQVAGVTITSCTVGVLPSTSPALTCSTPATIDTAYRVSTLLTGGIAGDYTVTFIATLSTGQVLPPRRGTLHLS